MTLRTDVGGPSFGKLVGLELRKSTDTRSGKALIIISFGLILATLAIVCIVLIRFKDDIPLSLSTVYAAPTLVGSLLLPVIGILTMSTEWSGRSALVTFTQVPRRGRILIAKVISSLAIALAVSIVTILLGLVSGYIIKAATDQNLSLDEVWKVMAYPVLLFLLTMLWGVAFGMFFQSGVISIVLYYVIPSVIGAITGLAFGFGLETLQKVIPYFDASTATDNLANLRLTTPGLPGASVPATFVALAIFIVLPIVFGAVRWMRREVQ